MNDRPSLPATPSIRILIVTDVRLFSEGLTRVLGNRGDLQVVGATSPGDGMCESVTQLQPDVVLVDAATVRTSELALSLSAILPTTRVVAFALAQEDESEVMACAAAGVAGFVSRRATVEELMLVLKSAMCGQVNCPPEVATLICRQVARLSAFTTITPDDRSLTQREAQVGGMLEMGLSNKEISGRLGIEVATVKNHVHSLFEKLRVRRRSEAAALMRSQRRWLRSPAQTVRI